MKKIILGTVVSLGLASVVMAAGTNLLSDHLPHRSDRHAVFVQWQIWRADRPERVALYARSLLQSLSVQVHLG